MRIVAGADLVVHAGDFMREEAYAEIEAIGPPLVARPRQRRRRAAARAAAGADRGATRAALVLGVIHDAGPRRARLARMRRAFPDADAVVFGHSHIPLHERDSRRLSDLQPGQPDRAAALARGTRWASSRSVDGALEFELIELD